MRKVVRDNLSSHFNVSVFKFCDETNVSFIKTHLYSTLSAQLVYSSCVRTTLSALPAISKGLQNVEPSLW